jgi:hypothetical protein
MEFYGLGICPARSIVLGRKGVCKDIVFGVWVPSLLFCIDSLITVQK